MQQTIDNLLLKKVNAPSQEIANKRFYVCRPGGMASVSETDYPSSNPASLYASFLGET
jgi:hypothetical protein